METLEQIKPTMAEIDPRIPDALRVAFRLGGHRLSSPGANDNEGFASFVAAVLPAPPVPDCPAVVPAPRAARALRLDVGSCYLPHHDHDSHFGASDFGVLGVADGVGGYSERGVDAGAFSRGLMTSAFAAVVSAPPGAPVCPYTLLELAYEETAASAAPGASTAVILSLAPAADAEESPRLRWAYIGDSGFAVLRRGKILRRSRPQQSRFNCPYQLNSTGNGDRVTAAETGEVPVEEGDVVVAGTDGLFDNMFDEELERVVRMGAALGLPAKNMADVIAGVAYEMSRNRARDSPFSVESRRHHRADRWSGGKEDDITVVVAFVALSY